MTTLRLTGFTGEAPKIIPRLLPNNAATEAFDARLENGDLRPFRDRFAVFSDVGLPVSPPATIYLHNGGWLFWPTLVNAAPGPVASDRLYFTGSGAPKMRVGATDYDLAIPRPATALVPTVTGAGVGDSFSTLWVYTNVSQFGEESEPSPVSAEMLVRSGQDIDLSGFSDAMGSRTAVSQRIYQSLTTLSGQTQFFFLAERPAGVGNFTYQYGSITLQESLTTTDYNPPPATLAGLISLPNGLMAAFSGKDVYFCEPYIPQAWPEKYVLTVDYPIVALGAYGSTIIVMTEGNPYAIQGTDPATMFMEKLELNMPCINAAGVVDLGYAIAYPSQDGLAIASSGGVRIATEQLFSRKQWQELAPENFVAGQYDGRYFATYNYFDVAGTQFTGTIILDLTGEQPFVIRTANVCIAMHYDIPSSTLFMLDQQQIWEFDSNRAPRKVLNWRSKDFVLQRPTNFGAIYIDAVDTQSPTDKAAIEAQIAEVIARNQALLASGNLGSELNGGPLNGTALGGSGLFAVPELDDQVMSVGIYADKELVAVITEFNEMVRLPSGFIAREWFIDVSCNISITEIALATTGAELGVV